jgi:hypothetical protein
MSLRTMRKAKVDAPLLCETCVQVTPGNGYGVEDMLGLLGATSTEAFA